MASRSSETGDESLCSGKILSVLLSSSLEGDDMGGAFRFLFCLDDDGLTVCSNVVLRDAAEDNVASRGVRSVSEDCGTMEASFDFAT
jgi:hypothetical protein